MTYARSVKFIAAFDRRNDDPRKDYGVHGVDIIFRLSKDGQAVEWRLFTGWQLPHVAAKGEGYDKPMPSTCRYHSKTPRHNDQEQSANECEVTGGVCYSDGTFVTDDLFDALREGGDEAVWALLEKKFEAWLGVAQ